MMFRYLEWDDWDGVEIPQNQRDVWAARLLNTSTEPGISFTGSGDSLVMLHRQEDGIAEVFDLVVRRHMWVDLNES